MKKEQVFDINSAIDVVYIRNSDVPIWVSRLPLLDRKKFPDAAKVSDLLSIGPKTLREKFISEINVIAKQEWQMERIFEAIRPLQKPCVFGVHIQKTELTLGQLRTITRENLAKINGLTKNIDFRAAIIIQLFGLR